MPLDITTPQETYNAPTSSPDPYASTTDTDTYQHPTPISLDTLSLPSGLPILGPLTGYTPHHLARVIESRNRRLSQTVARPLSDQEFTALAYHTAKGVAISSYGPTLGFGAAAYRIWATRNEFWWPFYGALKSDEVGKGVWDGERLRIGGKEVLKQLSADTKARMLHLLRGTSYLVLGLFIVPMALSSYGATVSTVGELRDRRMSAITRALRSQAEEEMKGLIEKRAERKREQEGLARATEPGKGNVGVVSRGRKRGGKVADEDDDMSPTGGGIGFGDDDELGRLSTVGDTGDMFSDRQLQEREAKAPPEATRIRRPSTIQPNSPVSERRTFDDSFSDASPTAIAKSDSSATGSAWERIRQQSTSDSSGSAHTQPRSESQRRGNREQQERDGFMFSSEEAERGYARDEAQKEFDERVERERRGGEFGEGRRGGGSGGGSGWRR